MIVSVVGVGLFSLPAGIMGAGFIEVMIEEKRAQEEAAAHRASMVQLHAHLRTLHALTHTSCHTRHKRPCRMPCSDHMVEEEEGEEDKVVIAMMLPEGPR